MKAHLLRSLITGFVLTLTLAHTGHTTTISDTPAYLSAGVPPLVMLDISKDQQLYKKAYNDYSDLDGDGQLETGYKHSVDYYGYFDPYKCYTYSSTNGRFEPSLVNIDKYCASGTAWSGNFLNWSTMTRMDAVRKLLYGGYRSTDGVGVSGVTVLERVFLPTDAHAFAKYYNGTDINQLTPFSTIANTPASISSTSSATIGTGKRVFNVGASTTSFSYGDQVIIRDNANPTTNYMIGAVGCVNGTGISMYNTVAASADTCATNELAVAVESTAGAGTITNWKIENWSQVGITICNATLSTTTNPPLMRVAKGNFALWSANERWQCYWREDAPSENTTSLSGGTSTSGNRAALSGLYSSSISPNKTTISSGRIKNGLDIYDFNVRVKACASTTLIGTEKCREYPNGNLKPIGLLQIYGENDQMRFGLMTGSYNKNISGGVLRKNIGVLTDEINIGTDGTFISPAPVAGNIINTLNKMRIYGYNYGDGTYLGSSGDNCTYQLTNITEGNCRSWGNPMSEIFYETLRYFAGKSSPTSAYTYSGTTADSTLGLPLATWNTALLSNSNYCAPLNALIFNASVSTNDDDLRTQSLTDINGTGSTAETKSNSVGAGEGINGTTRYVGKIVGTGATSTADAGFELCTSKTVPGLGQISGICPEGPTLAGSYLLPGLAYHANTTKIRTDLTVPGTDTTSLKVKTYGVQLATNVPQIRIAVSGETTPRIIIQPAYRLNVGGTFGGGALVDMKIVTQSATATTATGTIYLNWEDSEQGGDYDQDVWGTLSYSLNTATNQITVTTRTIAESTGSGQGFGYIISGTTKDGPHFHSGIENFDFTDTTGITISPAGYTNAVVAGIGGGCSTCNLSDPATTATYTLSSTVAVTPLQDPLFYAAKWGGFTDTNASGTPDLAEEFDKTNNTSGASASDTIPDNYFLVSNPLYLETAMTNAFLKILATSSASAVATNSTSLRTDSLIFQARFNSKDWSGQVLAYTIDSAGNIGTTAVWDAGQKVNSQAATSRNIITMDLDTRTGIPFRWSYITAETSIVQEDFLNKNGSGTVDSKGSLRVDYLRGDQSNEGAAVGKFRSRPVSRLGDIAFSNPRYVGAPDAGYIDATYSTFRSTYSSRTPMLYVGGNDGMLHGFNACYPASGDCTSTAQGTELLAYVPNKIFSNLSKLTDQTYSHKFFVDGSPTVGDAYGNIGQCGSACWRSVLVGGLNAGGQGVYALDVTDPTQFSEGNAANLLLWEFTNTDDVDLGYTYSKPIIARLSNGKWAAIFGNGYNSTSGTAALYVLYLDKAFGAAWVEGTNYFKLDTGCKTSVTACTPVTGGNGLSSVTGWDKNGDGNIDYVYAGDLQGNMWKFDISGTPSLAQSTGWKVASGSSPTYAPLYTAQDLVTTPNRQPITTAPTISAHPISGILVFFGTGKVLETADISDKKLQTFYAIWDKNDGSAAASSRSALLEQKILTETSTSRTTTQNVINWRLATSTPPDYLGWYMDLVVVPPPTTSNMKGERHVGTPQLFDGVIFFNTYVPSTVACDFGGTGWLMGLDYASGGFKPYAVFDTNGDGVIDSNDTPSSGTNTDGNMGGTTFIETDGDGDKIGLTSGQDGGLDKDLVYTQGLRGRVTWRELIRN